jgi:nucleoside-diphosphate-sugar epimerase
MKVFIAGASGAVGRRLAPLLVAEGHQVTGSTTSPSRLPLLESLGLRPVVMDGLDPASVKAAVAEAEPEVVVSELTGLAGAKANLRRFDEQFELTNRLRTEGTAHLVAAAQAVGSRRFVAQSFTGWTNPRSGTGAATEDEGLDPDPARPARRTLAAIAELERLVTTSPVLEGLVLRYGLLYGPGNAISRDGDMGRLVARRGLPIVGRGTGQWSFVHVDDAAAGTALAVRRGAPGLYNIVDDHPAPITEWLPVLAQELGAKPPRHIPAWLARPLIGPAGMAMMLTMRGSSNAKARRELGWTPVYPDWRQGFHDGLG